MQKTVVGLEVARLIAIFLDKTVKYDDSFELLYACRKDKSIPIKPLRPRSNGPIIIFYHELYEKTKDTAYKDKADKAVEFWLNKCAVEGGSISCGQNFNPFAIYYKATRDPRYLNALTQAGKVFFENISAKELSTTNYGFKLEILYNLTHEKKYKTRLEEITDQLLRVNNLEMIKHYFMPTYRLTEKVIYLNAAKSIIKKVKTTSTLAQMSIFLEDLLEMNQLSAAEKLAQKLILEFWDTPWNRSFNGDFGFVDDVKQTNSSTKTTTLIAEIGQGFIRMSDIKFTVLE